MKIKVSELISFISVIMGLMFISTAIVAYWGKFQYILIVLVGLVTLGYGIFFINRFLHKKNDGLELNT